MTWESIVAVTAGLQAMGVFALIGKAWGWMLRTERRLVRIEAHMHLLKQEDTHP